MTYPAEVRPEYEALARDFRAIAGPFGLRVDDSLEVDLILAAACFEAVDRHVDATPDAADRLRLCAAILGELSDGGTDELLPRELASKLAAIRVRLVSTRVLDAFVADLARFFSRSEALRQTPDGREFVRCVVDEARCAAEMTLLIIPGVDGTPFSRFFRVLSEIANLVDKLHDVRGDRSRGEVAVSPGIVLHLRLLAAFAIRLPALLLLAHRPLHLISWGSRYLAHAPPKPVQPVNGESPVAPAQLTRARMTRR